jgi:hypothetical protein
VSLSLKPYDEAVTNYFKAIFDNVVYAPTDLAFKKSAEDNGGKYKLPLISVFRTPTISVTDNNNVNEWAFRRGTRLGPNKADGTFERLRLLPVQIEYQVDIWTEGVESVTGFFAELLFYVKDYPAFEVQLPSVPDPLGHILELTDVVDNTDLLEEADRGRLGRMSLVFKVDAFVAKFIGDGKLVLNPSAEVTHEFP